MQKVLAVVLLIFQFVTEIIALQTRGINMNILTVCRYFSILQRSLINKLTVPHELSSSNKKWENQNGTRPKPLPKTDTIVSSLRCRCLVVCRRRYGRIVKVHRRCGDISWCVYVQVAAPTRVCLSFRSIIATFFTEATRFTDVPVLMADSAQFMCTMCSFQIDYD